MPPRKSKHFQVPLFGQNLDPIKIYRIFYYLLSIYYYLLGLRLALVLYMLGTLVLRCIIYVVLLVD